MNCASDCRCGCSCHQAVVRCVCQSCCVHDFRLSESSVAGYSCWKCGQWMPSFGNSTITTSGGAMTVSSFA